MNIYDIFRSEGGFRVCLSTWDDEPIIDSAPWYETEAEAQDAAKYYKFRDQTAGMGIVRCSPTRFIACLGDGKFIDYASAAEAKSAVITEIERMGYSFSDVAKYGRSILEG